MSDTELKPCPFCGSPAKFEYMDYDPSTGLGDDGMGWAKCINMACGARIFDDRDSAVEMRNTRSQDRE